MERMKGSVGETKELLYGSSDIAERYVPSAAQSQSRNYDLSAATISGFVMPKINYRHLESSNRHQS